MTQYIKAGQSLRQDWLDPYGIAVGFSFKRVCEIDFAAIDPGRQRLFGQVAIELLQSFRDRGRAWERYRRTVRSGASVSEARP